MIIFLLILFAGLTLIYLNVSPVFSGKKGKFFALGILGAIFISMLLRETLVGAIGVSFFAVWLCQALWIYLLWSVFRIIRRVLQKNPLKSKTIVLTSRILLALTLGITIGLIIYGVPHNNRYKIIDTKVEIKENVKDFTVAFFSDIHVDPLFQKEKLKRIIADMDSIKPDFLLFGGDLADVSTKTLDEWGYDSLFLELTSKAKIKAIGINGNHEAMQEQKGSSPDNWMKNVGFLVLDDSTACVEQVCFTGRTDFQVARSRGIERKKMEVLTPQRDSLFWILLDHQPRGLEPSYQGRLPNFAFSGHTHNGQFFPGNLVIGFVWKLSFGPGILDNVPWIVSAGVDCWGPPVRVGTDADIWVVHFSR